MTGEEREWLESLLALDDGLNDWELDFITDMERNFPAQLSELQHDKLKSLSYDKGL